MGFDSENNSDSSTTALSNRLNPKKDMEYNFKKRLKQAQDGNPYASAFIADCYHYSWGVDCNRKEQLNWIANASINGEARYSIWLFFAYLQDNDRDSAISWLNNCINKDLDHQGLVKFYAKKLLDLVNANPSVTTEQLFNSFDEEKDEYFLGLCYLNGFGCSKDVMKAARLLLKLANVQLEHNKGIGVLASFYTTQILLIQCLFELELGGMKDTTEGKELFASVWKCVMLVAISGDYSLANYDEISPLDGYYELSLIIGMVDIPYLRKELCRTYAEDLKDVEDSTYPTFEILINEAIALNDENDAFKEILFDTGLKGNFEVKKESGELLIKHGCLHEGYVVLGMLYYDTEDYHNRLKYLKLWSDLNVCDENYWPSSVAQYLLGLTYHKIFMTSNGTDLDIENAIRWWKKSAQNGYADSQEMLDKITDIGNGNLGAGIKALKEEKYGDSRTASTPSPQRQRNIPQQPIQYQQAQPQQQDGNGLAIASLITGILGIFTCTPCAIVSIILAVIAKSKGNRSGLATAGLVLGIVGMLMAIIFFGYFFINSIIDYYF